MKKIMFLFFPLVLISIGSVVSGQRIKDQRAESLAYFEQMTKVLQHPRCLNCHPAGDHPSQGMDMHQHLMNVQRGAHDHGAAGMKCATCHGDQNNSASGVPGAPHWALAPKKMAWVGLSKKELCMRLKDPENPELFAGGMTKEKFIAHNRDDKLVAWGWNPGEGREPVPFTQAKFGQIVEKWIQTGAACPD